MRVEFKDAGGRAIGTVESDNEDLLLVIEKRMIGTRVETDELSAWIATATVTDDDGVHVMDHPVHAEPGS